MWAVVPATLNSLSILICTCTASRMAKISSFPHHTSAQKILRFVANLSDEHVEEVFQGIIRMPHISSVVLDCMAWLLSDIFEDSRNVLLPHRGGRTSNRKAPKLQSEHPARGCVTRSIAKAGKEDACTKRFEEEDINVRTESKNECTTVPICQPHQRCTIFNTQL